MESKKSEKNSQLLILNSNIIQYIVNQHIATKVIEFLNSIDTSLAISEISIAEILAGCSITQEDEFLNLIQKFTIIKTTDESLILSARLLSIYNKLGISNIQINLADRIIASACVISKSSILTADLNDFPRPIFYEVETKNIVYSKNNKNHLLVLQILKPNLDFSKAYFGSADILYRDFYGIEILGRKTLTFADEK